MSTQTQTARVVIESMFGNTRAVGEAVAAGLQSHFACEVVDVLEPTRDHVDLLVVGGPTHAFSMSRPSTRQDAIRQGAPSRQTVVGLREWIEALPNPGEGAVATFDTRVAKVRRLPGSAARAAAKALRHRGYRLVGSESFYVDDVSGPLLDGELERARQWATTIADEFARRAA